MENQSHIPLAQNGPSNLENPSTTDSIADIAIPPKTDAHTQAAEPSTDAGSNELQDTHTDTMNADMTHGTGTDLCLAEPVEDKGNGQGACNLPSDCPCAGTEDCAAFDKLDLCAGVHLCVEGSCILQPSSAVKCPKHQHPCKIYACDPKIGLCLEEDLANGASCDDGDPCSVCDICLSDSCSGVPMNCDDENDCTADQCEAGECVHEDLCADGNPCSVDICNEDGTCDYKPLDCDDQDQCTEDLCSMESGDCYYEPTLCEDNDDCTDNICESDTGCFFPIMAGCGAGFAKVNEELLEKKCVPCHEEGGGKRVFVGDFSAMSKTPQTTSCQNMASGLPFSLAACIWTRVVSQGSMPPDWYVAEIYLDSSWDENAFHDAYTPTEADKLLLNQWMENNFGP